jgi:hypothetical protein
VERLVVQLLQEAMQMMVLEPQAVLAVAVVELVV